MNDLTYRAFPPHVRRIAVRWARSHRLQVSSAAMWPLHDYLHARFGLGIDCEGIVLAIEYHLREGRELSYQKAQFWTLAFGLSATDNYTEQRAMQAFQEVPALIEEMKGWNEKSVCPA